MTGPLLALFTTSAQLTGTQRLLLMVPLCLSVAVVYKTTRLENMREVPAAVLVLWITIVLSMCAVGLGLWALFSILV
jgi:protein gp37